MKPGRNKLTLRSQRVKEGAAQDQSAGGREEGLQGPLWEYKKRRVDIFWQEDVGQTDSAGENEERNAWGDEIEEEGDRIFSQMFKRSMHSGAERLEANRSALPPLFSTLHPSPLLDEIIKNLIIDLRFFLFSSYIILYRCDKSNIYCHIFNRTSTKFVQKNTI